MPLFSKKRNSIKRAEYGSVGLISDSISYHLGGSRGIKNQNVYKKNVIPS